ncbi:MAG: Stage V sporulation protein e [Candidatus Falkowbacteria bacterium GW2011_GWC2_38_22]|uniref:Probable peptidoglycan glycosyltransferase FtsW n=1 Tax=Candidatus Falkowbacteria bacterium GW2011_GWE1_38_31 TaxID=1618638 RepID=A0A0G0N0T0_9BACT|nr:MAG: Stage V sporulation protein e [Candidatus Falkowbacteria bacterium GW2011_GWF2_38_1205]KKQ61992.1 MAG: Stage V sporulation protein e [Candidatus Falkowbacteria bacterium GW2011_GWC2_38_22]KKQ63846.1 MAG: Stage V sporulation protein e [Candidatus Falkowbacteria bacterium GW2011_GWF1_38_22]KKQ66103.1 MAG: Stage V sporulation protein e [Candidatus Falkowbacteria bacterium GW2011_GWE2_38_254]KKQ70706.1 MAG: Stage V sporulation protein e [Candidatus Falkowbacteria bacterium GW2011_GWE1_38_31
MSLKKKLTKLLDKRIGYHEPDKALMLIIGVIVIFGLISLSSASAVVAYDKFGDVYYYFKHQLQGLTIGIAAFIFFSRVDYHLWRKYAFWFLIGSIFLLLLVFIPGLSAHYGKARSWINVFGFSLQPSEFVKLSFLLYLAAWLETRKKSLHEISQGIGPFIAVLGFIALLMLLQPDLGTLSIVTATSLIVYFAGGGKKRHLVTICLVGVLALTAIISVKTYQQERFKCLLDPNYDSRGACYQINQSLIAVGSGGVLGRGLGASRQKYMYLPEVSGDSIFAIIAEETGLLVCIALICAYLFLFYRGYLIAKNAPDDFGKILAIGIVSWIVIQAIINIGGIINLMPMTGVPLPLISYGGSAILAALAACGILVNISKQTKLR